MRILSSACLRRLNRVSAFEFGQLDRFDTSPGNLLFHFVGVPAKSAERNPYIASGTSSMGREMLQAASDAQKCRSEVFVDKPT